jgi:hypothetical protein
VEAHERGQRAATDVQLATLGPGQFFGELVVGKIMLTQPGCRAFKQGIPWLRDVTYLPYTVLSREGARVAEFASS